MVPTSSHSNWNKLSGSILEQPSYTRLDHDCHLFKRVYISNHLLGARRGIPDQLMLSCNHIAKIDIAHVPSPDEAVRQFTQDGGNLTLWSPFGSDPLAQSPQLQNQRQEDFNKYIPDVSVPFHQLVNGDPECFQRGLKLYIILLRL